MKQMILPIFVVVGGDNNAIIDPSNGIWLHVTLDSAMETKKSLQSTTTLPLRIAKIRIPCEWEFL